MTVHWEVDGRAPTLWTRLYVLGMRARRDKQAFEGEEHTLAKARQAQRRGDAPPTRLTRWVRRVATAPEAGQRDGMTTWTVRPRRTAPRARVLYVHGGGYVHPLTTDYWRLVRALSGRSAAAEVVVPAYPLAPDATVDDALPCLLDLAREAAADDLPLVLMGDSAGGALVLVLARCLRDEGGPQADRVVALSPWLDPTLDEDAVRDLEATDPMLAESGLRAAARWWAGRRPVTDPLVDPLRDDLDGLPPLHLHIGDRDILRPAVDALADRVRGSHGDPGDPGERIDLRVHEVPAMFHVWMTRAIPEAARSRRQLAALVREVGATS
ncbi:alpha/beta hydrolase fold domain-containing protein [Nocardioides deserti]|uniref:Alpha/beta hydrolase fold domain-containing protein n=1 Tax=Nocardioides deserti TaxID=1588644 RepID=A0ABR6U840_9ACTN|nr:alpha/beta hydrolase [Nocardioides deserti]MBC2960604.1 alpha/beta hydrolase fold domain-containing protein [Nocardioides deserti]GGO70894.1 putative esterase [Nocardioides deserti]